MKLAARAKDEASSEERSDVFRRERGYTSHCRHCYEILTHQDYARRSIANSVMGRSDLLTVDLAFLVEGQTEEELPESLLAVVRLHHLKMGLAPTITEWDETQRARRPAWETEDDFNQSGEEGGILTGNSYLIDV